MAIQPPSIQLESQKFDVSKILLNFVQSPEMKQVSEIGKRISQLPEVQYINRQLDLVNRELRAFIQSPKVKEAILNANETLISMLSTHL